MILRKFTQADPVMNVYNPQNLNRYAYTLNNPYKYTDPTGKWAVAFELGATASFFSGGGSYRGGIFVVGNEKTGNVQVGTLKTYSGSGRIGISPSASLQVGGFSVDNIQDYTDFTETSSQSAGVRGGLGPVGLEFNKEFSNFKPNGWSLYYTPGLAGEAHAGVNVVQEANLLWESHDSSDNSNTAQGTIVFPGSGDGGSSQISINPPSSSITINTYHPGEEEEND